ncbi:MAG: hypothetical protein KGY81_04570 [Phycisphaerae bacterium]|nr:hypothetical protein [Phycisphaerae bacterium]
MTDRNSDGWNRARALAETNPARLYSSFQPKTESEASELVASGQAVLAEKDPDEADRKAAVIMLTCGCHWEDVLRAKSRGMNSVPIREAVRADLRNDSVDLETVRYVCAHVDTHQRSLNMPPSRDDVIGVIIPWFGRVWSRLAADALEKVVYGLGRMVSEWPEEDAEALEPLMAPLAKAGSANINNKRAGRHPVTASDRAVLWDVVEWQTFTGKTGGVAIAGLAIVGSPEDVRTKRDARRQKRDEIAARRGG